MQSRRGMGFCNRSHSATLPSLPRGSRLCSPVTRLVEVHLPTPMESEDKAPWGRSRRVLSEEEMVVAVCLHLSVMKRSASTLPPPSLILILSRHYLFTYLAKSSRPFHYPNSFLPSSLRSASEKASPAFLSSSACPTAAMSSPWNPITTSFPLSSTSSTPHRQ